MDGIEREIIERFRHLRPTQQRQARDFVARLAARDQPLREGLRTNRSGGLIGAESQPVTGDNAHFRGTPREKTAMVLSYPEHTGTLILRGYRIVDT
jgi:hypothetical protein